jgi:hypothetical protein
MLVLPKLFAVVVAWPSLVTDVVLGSTSGSCCRACDAPSRVLCRVGLGGRLGRLSRLILTAAATSLESDHCVVATCLVGCVVRLVVEGPISFFLLFVDVLLCCCFVWGVNHSLCGSVSRFVFTVLSASFFLMQRHVKSC